MKSGI